MQILLIGLHTFRFFFFLTAPVSGLAPSTVLWDDDDDEDSVKMLVASSQISGLGCVSP